MIRYLSQVGDRVIVLTDYKAWSEVVVVNANFVYKMPDSLSFQDGAALAMNYLTAYIMLFDIGNLGKGKSVLLHSAGGGVVSHLTWEWVARAVPYQ